MTSVNYVKDDTARKSVVSIPTSSDVDHGWFVDELFYNSSGAAIAPGAWVIADNTKTTYPGREAAESGTTSNDYRIIGVCMGVRDAGGGASGTWASAADASWFTVRRHGLIDQAIEGFYTEVVNTTVKGFLKGSTTAGKTDAATVGTDHVVGVNHAVATASGSTLVEVRCL